MAIISYWSLNDGLPVPAAKNFQTPFYAPFLRFRWFNAATPSTCYKPEPAITAGNFPPVMAREQRTVSNESHVQTPIQRKLVTFRDSPRWLCRNLLMTDDDAIVAGSAVAVLTWMAMRPDFNQQVTELVRHTIHKLAAAESIDPLEIETNLHDTVFAPALVALYEKLSMGLSQSSNYDIVERDALAAFANALVLQGQYYLQD